MNKRIVLFIATVILAVNVFSQPPESKLFISPLNNTPSLSASFAELRADHFHSGIDYKTDGVTGKEVLAADDGYVYRIAVSPTGFGKALYIRHSSGYSTVYAHLKSFRPDIEDYVKQQQYEKKSYSVSLFPQRSLFRVTRGEVIAWSGNTGGSSGPHLHFEIRDSSSEDPVNPLEFNLGIKDKVRPVIEKIIVYPLSRCSSVNDRHENLSMKAVPFNGSYGIAGAIQPVVYGNTGIGIKCWDNFDNSSNRCGIYSIELFEDGLKIYDFVADRFSFRESRYINSHIDYAARIKSNEYIHMLYLQPGNKLSMNEGIINRGILEFHDDSIHEIKIVVSDIRGNKSWVTFTVRSVSEPPVPCEEIRCDKIMPYGKPSDFTAEGIRIHFPSGSLYDTLFFNYSVKNGPYSYLSPVHSVHNETVAINERFRLSIKPDSFPEGYENKLCLALINRKGIPSYAGGKYNYGYVSEDVNSLGSYAVVIDTVPPLIRQSFTSGANLNGRSFFKVFITDDFSGIKDYQTLIDGEWALAEYDAKNNLLICRFDKSRLKTNTSHRLEITVTDNCGNKSVQVSEFNW